MKNVSRGEVLANLQMLPGLMFVLVGRLGDGQIPNGTHTPATEHTPETEGFAPEKKTLLVVHGGYGPVRGDKQPPISSREK